MLGQKMVDPGKKPDPAFVIRLVGRDVKPWVVPMRSLSRIMAAVQRLVDQRDELADVEENDDESSVTTDTRTLQLLSVRVGSAGYGVSSYSPQPTMTVLRETGLSIDSPDDAKWRPATISSIDDLSQVAKQLGCSIELRESKNGKFYGDVLAVIGPDTYSQVQRRAFATGHTSVYGRLERVGGVTDMKCGIHVQDHPKMLVCPVANSDLVRELGKHIYNDVVLSGEAVWYRFNHQLKSLTVSSFSPAKTESFSDVAKMIRDAGGHAWDLIEDPDEYIREMRS
jgi:hypothetical protein